jgi:hypothetical protein
MVHDKYNSEESIDRIKLMMNYDSSKTLNENRILIQEQDVDTEYFNEIAKQFMKYPNNISINPGTPTIDVPKSCVAFYKTISGVGRRDTDYVTSKIFTSLPNSIGILKAYPTIGKETIYDAIKGEWFSGGFMDKVVNTISGQIKDWCSTGNNKKNKICTVKTKEELKYGI